MSTATVKVVGLESLLKKLDAKEVVEPEKTWLLKQAADETKSSLGPTLPDGPAHDKDKLTAVATPLMAKVMIPRYPFIFLEAGSQYHQGAGARPHTRKTAAQFKAGKYRISPRRYLTKERTKVRKRLVTLIESMKARVEKRWSA